MRITFAFTLALLGIFASAISAGEIHGTITDSDGAAVAGASVTLYARDSGVEQSTRSDGQGAYQFDSIAGGTYLVRASADGFDTSRTEPVAISGEGNEQRDLALTVAGLRTQVMVTASSTPLVVEEISKAASVVTAEEMHLRDTVSLPDALRLLPGFRVVRQGGPGSLTAIRVRGLRQYDTALLVDGLRMRDASDTQGSAGSFWQSIALVTPARAEVLRGSGSSLYGTHAIGGVVNLVSDTGGGAPHGEILTEGGMLDSFRGVARGSGGAFDNRLIYSGGVAHWNVLGGFEGVNPARDTSAQGFVRYALRPGMHWSGRLLASDLFSRNTDGPHVVPELEANIPATGIIEAVPLPDSQVRRVEQGLAPAAGDATYLPSLNDPDDRGASRFVNIATIFTHRLSPNFTWRVAYQLVDSTRSYEQGPGGNYFEPAFSQRNQYDGRVHLVQIRADYQAGKHQLISAGYEFEDEFFSNPNTDENPDTILRAHDRTSVGERSHSVFGQDQIAMLDGRLRVSLSGRLQAFQLEEPTFEGGSSPYAGTAVPSPANALTGDAAVSYLIGASSTKVRAHVGSSYRAPSLFERYGSSFYLGAFSAFGDPRLSPEQAVSVDAGIDQYLFGSKLQLSATYFYTNLNEIILFDFTGRIPADDPFGRFGGYLNTGGGLSRGVETAVTANLPGGMRIDTSYTYTNALDSEPWAGGVLRTERVSKHMFSAVVSRWITRRLNVTADLFTASDYLMPLSVGFSSRAFRLAGPVSAGVAVRYVIPVSDTRSLEIYTKLDNLANRDQYEYGYRTPGITANGGLRVTF